MSTPQTSAPAITGPTPSVLALGRDQVSRPTNEHPTPSGIASAGPDSLDGHPLHASHAAPAVEGNSSPQANHGTTPNDESPAGSKAGRGHARTEAHSGYAAATDFSGDQEPSDDHSTPVAGDSVQPTAIADAAPLLPALSAATSPGEATGESTPRSGAPLTDQTPPLATGHSVSIAVAPGVDRAGSPAPAIPAPTPVVRAPELADPLLALAADVLDDLESVRIANENRMRQLTRDEEDSDGEERGFGLTLDHPDVARLAALVTALADAEKAATKNLEKRLREHLLYPWLKRQKGVGDKQAARLLASIGDPYMRPEMVREDGTIEAARPRRVSELWAYAGYHVLPVGTQRDIDTHTRADADRASNSPAGHMTGANHLTPASGGKTGHPDQLSSDPHDRTVGVAPKRARGQRANWSSTAKMRSFLIAESTMKQLKRTCPADEERGYATHTDGCECSGYRKVYDAAREKYAGAVHHAECIRCGPKGKPAPVGSDLSRKHKQARALRIVSKELLKDLWREARRIHLGEDEAS